MAIRSTNRTALFNLILVPSVITLAITLLRVTGELRHWSPTLFNSTPGGGGALVGITWLVLVFGVYFALRLASEGNGPASVGRSIGMAVFGLVVMACGGFVSAAPQVNIPGKLVIGLLLFVAAIALQFRTWPALSKVLLPPVFPETGFWMRFGQTVLVPQLIFWIAFTVVLGTLFGSVATAIRGREKVGTPVHREA
jgi:hypothetical protein